MLRCPRYSTQSRRPTYLRFHDLRPKIVSSLFEAIPSVTEIAMVDGHRSRYRRDEAVVPTAAQQNHDTVHNSDTNLATATLRETRGMYEH